MVLTDLAKDYNLFGCLIVMIFCMGPDPRQLSSHQEVCVFVRRLIEATTCVFRGEVGHAPNLH
jgi:hypothetical protein